MKREFETKTSKQLKIGLEFHPSRQDDDREKKKLLLYCTPTADIVQDDDGVNTQPTMRKFVVTKPIEVPAKLIISNLDLQVTQVDIRNLCSSFGRINAINLRYDTQGKCAEVFFERKAKAIKVMERYNGFVLGRRSMKIKLLPADFIPLSVSKRGVNRRISRNQHQDYHRWCSIAAGRTRLSKIKFLYDDLICLHLQ